MSNVAKLKKQAAELELKKQFDKALAIYVKLLDSFDQYPDELEVALFNRVGDLMLRQGNVADAVDYYEQAVDRYADTGFFNNAIALCNKILRHSPGRASVYYKLGKISAQKGFKTDAKVNFLEYADRMQKSGKVDEAFRALKEFADLCPDQDEIRLMLADQLTKADRKPEAVEQLQTLYERYDSEGRTTEANATAERMRTIDPSVEPRSGGGSQKSSSADLIFIDLDAPSPSSSSPSPTSRPSSSMPARGSGGASAMETPKIATRVTPPPVAPAPPRRSTPVTTQPPAGMFTSGSGYDSFIELPMDGAGTSLDGITRVDDDALNIEKEPTESLFGLESTSLTDDSAIAPPQSGPSLLDLESTSLDTTDIRPIHRSTTPTHGAVDDGGTGELEIILPDASESSEREIPSIDFDLSAITPLSTPIMPRPTVPTPRSMPTPRTSQAALEGLPLMDLDVPSLKPPGRKTRTLKEIAESGELDLIELVDHDASHETPAAGAPAANASDLNSAGPSPRDAAERRASAAIETPDEAFTLIGESTGDETTVTDEHVVIPTPPVSRKSTMVAAHSVELLRASVELEPENWGLRRQLAEAMLDAGERAAGIRELESAMGGAERSGDLDLASGIAEEIARLEPELVKHHQKRVEYAFRTNDRGRLIEAYLSLADSLLGSDQADKARAVYQRVIDLAPDEMRARTALEAIVIPEPPPPPPPAPASRRTSAMKQPIVEAPRDADLGDSFVNLGDWLRDAEGPKDTRMIVAEQEPTGDEDADFADMLRKFKQGVAENVDAEDYQSHYDLAIAFKEMGLLDEAISEFQKALGSPTNRLPTYEALGQCFIDKGQAKLASSILARALNEPGSEEQKVGVLYLLGMASETQGKVEDALGYFQRVFVLDIQFRDVIDRISELERPAR